MYGNCNNENTKTTVSVSSVNPYTGKIILESPPPSTIDCVVCTYYYYPKEVNLDLVSKACAVLAGYKYILAEYLLIPEQWYQGAMRFKHARPYQVLLEEYYRLLDLITKYHTKGEHTVPSMIRTHIEED